MVHASHIIIGMYGFWLPNDPRGSWSDYVGAWELLRFGKATTVSVRRSVTNQPYDRGQRAAAEAALKYPPVRLSGIQARAIGRGVAEFVDRSGVTVLACAILPRHMHLVLGRHRLKVEQIVNLLKGAATRQLNEEELHPLGAYQGEKRRPPKCFARGQWKVFLNTRSDIQRSIRYVEGNPEREGLPPQRWRFVSSTRVSAPLSGRG